MNAEHLPNPGSSSISPDLDWSQIRETVSMLCLAMAQVETTLTDSSRSVHELTNNFTDIAWEAKKIKEICEPLKQQNSEINDISDLAEQINSKINSTVVAFQFYDRLSQRLAHVNKALFHLGDLIGDKSRVYNPTEWRSIQNEVQQSYSMECERLMFQRIMEGASISEALELYRHEFIKADTVKTTEDSTDDDIELF